MNNSPPKVFRKDGHLVVFSGKRKLKLSDVFILSSFNGQTLAKTRVPIKFYKTEYPAGKTISL